MPANGPEHVARLSAIPSLEPGRSFSLPRHPAKAQLAASVSSRCPNHNRQKIIVTPLALQSREFLLTVGGAHGEARHG